MQMARLPPEKAQRVAHLTLRDAVELSRKRDAWKEQKAKWQEQNAKWEEQKAESREQKADQLPNCPIADAASAEVTPSPERRAENWAEDMLEQLDVAHDEEEIEENLGFIKLAELLSEKYCK
jgi:hypothetical protein